jgi:hypothetical protein
MPDFLLRLSFSANGCACLGAVDRNIQRRSE